MDSPYRRGSDWTLLEIIGRTWPGAGGCLLWQGAKRGGYGAIRVGGKIKIVPRVVWEIANGPIPDGLNVLHHCDRPACVHPDHLFLGTHADNMADQVAKGRHSYGQQHPQAKLSDETVLAILRSDRPGVSLAGRFGVSETTISKIKNGRRWAHLQNGANDWTQSEGRGAGNAAAF